MNVPHNQVVRFENVCIINQTLWYYQWSEKDVSICLLISNVSPEDLASLVAETAMINGLWHDASLTVGNDT